jgi:hypothetical protein
MQPGDRERAPGLDLAGDVLVRERAPLALSVIIAAPGSPL